MKLLIIILIFILFNLTNSQIINADLLINSNIQLPLNFKNDFSLLNVNEKNIKSTNTLDNNTMSNEYKKMIKIFPGLKFNKILSPEDVYSKSNIKKHPELDDEASTDYFYFIYYDILKEIIGKEYDGIRKKFTNISSMFYEISANLSGGGSCWGHDMTREPASIEYYYIYPMKKANDTLVLKDVVDTSNTFLKAKSICIKAFKQKCLNQIKDNNNYNDLKTIKEKDEAEKKIKSESKTINKYINKIEKQITNKHYLEYFKTFKLQI